MDIQIYHYSKCKKSRAALEYLRENGIQPFIIHYVEEGIDPEQLKKLFKTLKLKPLEMVRTQESYYEEVLRNKDMDDENWLKVLSEHPKLIKRPIIIYGQNAAIGDPPQKINQILTAYKKDHEDKN